MPKLIRRVPFPVLFALALAPGAAAQDAPRPAPELRQLQPFAGSWEGSGDFHEPAPNGGTQTTKWRASGSYEWCLDGFWLREDFRIDFDGMPVPMYHRSYLGWDGERRGFVKLAVSNAGEVALHDLSLLPDGSLLEMPLLHPEGAPMAMRSLFKVDGDTMVHTVDFLMPQGPALHAVDGRFRRLAKKPDAVPPQEAFMGMTPHAEMRKLAAWAGSYDVEGTMTMAPGAPPMQITGTDSYAIWFGGTVLCGLTEGAAEGMPRKYLNESFFAWDAKKGCLVCGFVSNMGEVGLLEQRFTKDGKALVGTMAGTAQGEPVVQRGVAALDDKGRPASATCHMLSGTAAPLENFRATYTKR